MRPSRRALTSRAASEACARRPKQFVALLSQAGPSLSYKSCPASVLLSCWNEAGMTSASQGYRSLAGSDRKCNGYAGCHRTPPLHAVLELCLHIDLDCTVAVQSLCNENMENTFLCKARWCHCLQNLLTPRHIQSESIQSTVRVHSEYIQSI